MMPDTLRHQKCPGGTFLCASPGEAPIFDTKKNPNLHFLVVFWVQNEIDPIMGLWKSEPSPFEPQPEKGNWRPSWHTWGLFFLSTHSGKSHYIIWRRLKKEPKNDLFHGMWSVYLKIWWGWGKMPYGPPKCVTGRANNVITSNQRSKTPFFTP